MEKCRRDFLWNKLLIGDLMDEDLKRNILSLQREDTQTGRSFHGEVSQGLLVEQTPHWGSYGRRSKEKYFIFTEKIHKLAVVSIEKCRRDFLWNKLLIGDLMDEDLKRNILSLQREDTQTSGCFHGEVSPRLPVEQAPHLGPYGRGSKEKYFIFTERRYTN